MKRMLPSALFALLVLAVVIAWSANVAGQGQKGGGAASGSRAETEKALVANERAINEAFAKTDVSKFREFVAANAWSIDPMAGRMSVADMLKQFDQMAKDMKMTSWDITDVKAFWLGQDAVVLTYKWTGSGTYQGQPIPSPTWASTVWSKRSGKWQAIFHQETLAGPPPKK
jgi:hypothetical protein